MFGMVSRTLTLTAIAVGLAACGGSSPSGEAAKSPRQIARDAAAATKSLRSFRLQGTLTDAEGFGRVSAEVAGPGRIHLALRRASSTFEVITFGAQTYLKASRSYYDALPGLSSSQAEKLSDRWVKVPTSEDPGLRAGAARATNIGVEVGCWAARSRGLRLAGTGTVAGRDAVIVANDGSAPGSAPGKVYVATSGPAWPLRAIVTGPRQPGGTGACAEESTKQTSDITVSAFNQQIHLAPPAGAIDLLGIAR
jgi:hypothetical protein